MARGPPLPLALASGGAVFSWLQGPGLGGPPPCRRRTPVLPGVRVSGSLNANRDPWVVLHRAGRGRGGPGSACNLGRAALVSIGLGIGHTPIDRV